MKLLVTLFLAACAHRQRRSGGSWGYSHHNGADWPDLNDDNSCGGSRQSPIDIPAETAEKPGVSFRTDNYDKEVPWEGINNGHAVQLTLQGEDKLKLHDGDLPGSYSVLQFHFHWGSASAGGSEHLVDGHHHFAEIHVVHTKDGETDVMNAGDGLGVLGFFVDVGATEEGPLDDLIQNKIAKNLLEPKSTYEMTMTLGSILPDVFTDYYRYLGSLTTPGCNEVVVWTVFKNPILISQKTKDAMVSFAEFDASDVPLVQNFRAAQPLAGRTVTFYSPSVTEAKDMPAQEPGENENDPNAPLSNEPVGNNTEPVGLNTGDQTTEQTDLLGDDNTNVTTTAAPASSTPAPASSSRIISYTSFVMLIPLFLFFNF